VCVCVCVCMCVICMYVKVQRYMYNIYYIENEAAAKGGGVASTVNSLYV